MVVKSNTTNCFKCRAKINKDKEKYVNLITYDKGKKIEELIFHQVCWGDFNQQKVNERLTQMANQGMKLLKQTGMMN